MKLKENKLCDDLMAYLRDLMEFSYEGENKNQISPTRPVSA